MSIEIPDFSRARVLVVGDIMLDRYWVGATARISPEAPVPVVRVEDEFHRPGGAGNVALNVSALGAYGRVVSIVGEDEPARLLKAILGEHGVASSLITVPGLPTITKLRVVSRHQQLLRLDFEDTRAPLPADRLLDAVRAGMDDAGVVVLSDYAKGALRESEKMIELVRARGKAVLVDPKGGSFDRYRGATLLTPNLAELEAVVGECRDESEIAGRAQELVRDLGLDAILVTRGEHGMTLVPRDRQAWHLPTHAREVYDVTGAGDTVIGVLAAGMAAGMPLETAVRLANVAAGIVVGKLGTATVSSDELRHALHELPAERHGVVEEEDLAGMLVAARARGERIVLTNGCFDILHAGHVHYLEQASRLGDRLVVAVNTDDSVRRLKGPDRPVNPVESRMAVLAALGCVDWVVPFTEQTPERLICRLQPDVLVKGGDNDPEKIPGGRCVRSYGGEVRVLGFLEGCSTTRLIKSIRGEARGAAGNPSATEA